MKVSELEVGKYYRVGVLRQVADGELLRKHDGWFNKYGIFLVVVRERGDDGEVLYKSKKRFEVKEDFIYGLSEYQDE